MHRYGWSALVVVAVAAALAPAANPGATQQRQGLGAAVASRVANLNAERLAVAEATLVGKRGGVAKLRRATRAVVDEKGPTLARLIEREGCVGLDAVLSAATAARLRGWIGDELARAKAAVEGGDAFETRFGGVNCRGEADGVFGRRQDLYLPVDGVVREALREVAANLRPLLDPLAGDGYVHEVSCLVAEPGSPRQCVHADTIVLPCPQYPAAAMAPLYTIFIALQDVKDDMGHTVFLPETHGDHALWNVQRPNQETYIASRRACMSKLRVGDAALFDSRCLHAGLANTSGERRVLFYCTLSKQRDWPLAGGTHGPNSIRADARGKWTLRDL